MPPDHPNETSNSATLDPLQAFRLIDARLPASPHHEQLTALRSRLAGELLGEAELVDKTLAPDFELVTHAQGHTAVLGRDTVLAAAGGQGGTAIWVELADLAVDDGVIAGHGVLRTLLRSSLRTAPFALFIRFDGALMTSEVVYMDAASDTAVAPDSGIPSRERLRDLLDLDHLKGHRWS